MTTRKGKKGKKFMKMKKMKKMFLKELILVREENKSMRKTIDDMPKNLMSL